jgi:RNA polymerase sporulation-specific sigma factor
LTDAALVLRARGGDQAAFERLAERHADLIHAITNKYFPPPGFGWEDLLQEASFGLHKAVRDYRADRESGFRNFAEIVIRRQVITAIKSATRKKHHPLNEAASFSSPVLGATDDEDAELGSLLPDRSAPDPLDEMERRERIGEVVALVGRLTPLERSALNGVAARHEPRRRPDHRPAGVVRRAR